MAPTITDPAKSLERVFERIHQTEAAKAAAVEAGRFGEAKVWRRRLVGLKAARTRIVRMLEQG